MCSSAGLLAPLDAISLDNSSVSKYGPVDDCVVAKPAMWIRLKISSPQVLC